MWDDDEELFFVLFLRWFGVISGVAPAPGLSLLVQEEDGNWDQMEGIFTGLSPQRICGTNVARHPHDGRIIFFE